MTGIVSKILLLTLQCLCLDCSKHIHMLVYKPYGIQMCRAQCKDLLDKFYYTHNNLSCHRDSTTHSGGANTVSPHSCLNEDIGKNDRNTFNPQTGFDVCIDRYEDPNRHRVPRVTTLASSGGGVQSNPFRQNMSLHQACKEGKLCLVQFILSERPKDINTRDKHGRSPVMAAAMKQQIAVFNFLINQDCDLTLVDNNNDTVLHVACGGGSIAIVTKLIVNHGCDVESRGWRGMTPVMRSALRGHRDIVDLLVSKGCNVTVLDDHMNNILHVACSGGRVEMVKYVLRILETDIESKGENGRTPVMIAAHSGHLEVFCFLASRGSNLSDTDSNKLNILHLACLGGHVHMVKYILNRNLSDIEIKAILEWTPVMSAVQHEHISVVKLLVNRGCNPLATDIDRNNILHIACMTGNVTMVKYILSKLSIERESIGKYGHTPLMTATIFGHMDLVKYLVNNDCKLSVFDSQGNDFLHVACMSGNADVVNFILKQKEFGIEKRGFYGQTPVMTAASCGQMSVVKYLVRKGCSLSTLDYQGNTVLHAACMGSVNVVTYIINQTKLEKERRGAYGRTPVMVSVYRGQLAVTKYLVSEGCKMSGLLDSDGNSILHLACISGNIDMVKYIFTYTNTGKDSRGAFKQTPVMTAACFGHMALVRYLHLHKGCNMSNRDERGNTILHLACMSGNLDLVKYIYAEKKIRKESRGGFGQTPLMIAAGGGHIDVVKYLAGEGCKLFTEDSKGNTILHLACMSGKLELVKYIFERTNIWRGSKGIHKRTPLMIATGHESIVTYLVSKGCKVHTKDAGRNNYLHIACGGGNY